MGTTLNAGYKITSGVYHIKALSCQNMPHQAVPFYPALNVFSATHHIPAVV